MSIEINTIDNFKQEHSDKCELDSSHKGHTCSCGCDLSDGAGHSRSMARLRTALIGGAMIANSYFLKLFFPDQIFAAELSAMIGAVVLTIPIFITAFKDLMHGRVHMNELVALSILASMTQGNFASAGIIAFLLLIGIIIESRTASGAQRSIEELIKLTPHTATVITENGEEVVDANRLQRGDIILVRPGENFPADGQITKGTTTVNQASITGESLPVDKDIRNDVFAGTMNLTGAVEVKVTKIGEDTTLGKVQELILAAEQTQTPIVRIIDSYAGFYTPTVLMIAGLTWWFFKDMNSVVSVLIISCPCALVLATPTAIVAAVAAASRLGILIKDVGDIEVAAKIKAFVFDKTGTLTEGKLSVAHLSPARDIEPANLLRIAASIEVSSNHPVAFALRQLATSIDVKIDKNSDSKEIHGKGMETIIKGRCFRAGRKKWLQELGIDFSGLNKDKTESEEGMSIIYVADEMKIIGWIGFKDTIRAEAADAIRDISNLGIKHCAMITGDRESVARIVADKLGINEVQAECLPDGKVDFVKKTKERLPVAVVGDGVNDAPALASGTLGIAMGAIGSDIAINSASIALMNNDLRRIPMLVKLARHSRVIMYQNIALGLMFVFGGISFSIFGVIPPIAAAFIHTISTLVIIFNSARLVRIGEELTAPPEKSLL